MEEREKIKKIFLDYINALESDNIDNLDEILADDVVLESTNYGNAVGREAVKQKLKWNGIPINYSRYKIFNFVAFTEDGTASQSAVVTSLVGINDPDYFYYFNFGGYYLNEYKIIEGEWRLSHIRFNLDMEDGNSIIVRGWWKMPDYRYFEGTPDYPIVSEVNNPWINIKTPDSLGSDEEQVLDSYYRYSWGIDHGDFTLFETCLDKEVYLFDNNTPKSKEQAIRFMKYKRYKEALMEHIWKIDDIKIDGDLAVLKTRRYEPHRMGTTKFNRLNMDVDFYTGSFEYEFVRREGKDYRDGGWKMRKNNITESRIISESTHKEDKFF